MHQTGVLIYHTDPVEVRVLTGMLRAAGYRVLSTDSVNEVKLLLVTLPVDVFIIDAPECQEAPPALLAQVCQRCPNVLRLLLVNCASCPWALGAMRQGLIHGMVGKPVRSTELISTVELAVTDPEALQPASWSPDKHDPELDDSAHCVNGG